jgi:dihydroorotate dehydrogenase (NAD+) catalytic subunit
VDLSTKICDLKIDPAWMNASGVLSQPQIIRRISSYDIGAFVTKSIGLRPREGFYEPVVYHDGKITLNSFGLANPGLETREELKEIYPLPNHKPLIASVFGENEHEFIEVATGLENYSDAIELNYSCPNRKEGEKIGSTIGINPDLVRAYTKAVKGSVKKPVIVKLTPNVPDIGIIAKAAEKGGADVISAINTVAPATKIDLYSCKPYLSNKSGGLSGKSIKPLGIAAVRKIHDTVAIPIIGGGGIEKAEDVADYFRAGASCVFIGTALVNKSTEKVRRYFTGLKYDMEELLEEMKIPKLRDLKGVRIDNE